MQDEVINDSDDLEYPRLDARVDLLDTSKPVDTIPDIIFVKGNTGYSGERVSVYDDDGNELGYGKADEKGDFAFAIDSNKLGFFENVHIVTSGDMGDDIVDSISLGSSMPLCADIFGHQTKASLISITSLDGKEYTSDMNEIALIKGSTNSIDTTVYVLDKNNQIIAEGTTDKNGNFELESTKTLSVGDDLRVFAGSYVGTQINAVVGETNFADETPPIVDVLSISNFDTDDMANNNNRIQIKGKSNEINTDVVITNDEGDVLGKGKTDENGNFDIQTLGLNPGDKFTVSVSDKAGNVGVDENIAALDGEFIYYTQNPTIQRLYPAKINITDLSPVDTNGDKKADFAWIRGNVKAEYISDNTVLVVRNANGDELGIGNIDENGDFGFKIFDVDVADKVIVETLKGMDAVYAGDLMSAVDFLEIAPSGDKAPSVDLYEAELVYFDGDTYKTNVKGVSDAKNALVIITDQDGNLLGEGTTDKDGKFDFYVDRVDLTDTHVIATVLNNEGNKGSDTKEIYRDDTSPMVDLMEIIPVYADETRGTIKNIIVEGASDEPNALVVVSDSNGKELGRGTTDDEGKFKFEAGLVELGEYVTATVIDKAGNKGLDTEKFFYDWFIPDTSPVVELTEVIPVDIDARADGKVDKTTVKGASDEPNALVVVSDSNGKELGRGTTDDEGNFEFDVDPVNSGTEVTVTLIDKAGNKGEDTKIAGPLTYDDKTPPMVELAEVTPVDTSELIDDIPEKTIIRGYSDEPNALVIVSDSDGKELGRGTTDDEGNFEFDVNPINPGAKAIATVIDKAGNEGSDTEQAPIIERPCPVPPSYIHLDSVLSIDTSDIADNIPELTIVKGRTNVFSTITFTDAEGNELGSAYPDSDGYFEAEIKAVNENTEVFATVIDEGHNKVDSSFVVAALEHTGTQATVVEFGDIYITHADTTYIADGIPDMAIIRGQVSEPNVTINITNEANELIGTTTSDIDSFELNVAKLYPGEKINISATSASGIVSEKTIEVEAQNMAYQPSISLGALDYDVYLKDDDNDANIDKSVISGLVSIKDTNINNVFENILIRVKDSQGKEIARTFADENGKFDFEILGDKIQDGDKISAEALSIFGDKLEKSFVASADPTPNEAPLVIIDDIEHILATDEAVVNSTTIKGTSDEPNAKTIVSDANGVVLAQSYSDENGNFLINLDALQGGESITVSVIDRAGNVGLDTKIVPEFIPPVLVKTQITDIVNDADESILAAALIKDASPKILGEAQANSSVEIYDGDKLLGKVIADENGKFEFSPKLKDGSHEIWAKNVSGNETFADSQKFSFSTDTDEVATANVSTKFTYSDDSFVSQAEGKVYRVNVHKGLLGKGKANMDEIESVIAVDNMHEAYSFKSSALWYSTDNSVNSTQRLSYAVKYKDARYTNSLKNFLANDQDSLELEQWTNKKGKLVNGENDGSLVARNAYNYISVESLMYIEAGTYSLTSIGGDSDRFLQQYVNDKFKMQILNIDGNSVTDGVVGLDYQNGTKDFGFSVKQSGFYKVNIAWADGIDGLGNANTAKYTASLRPKFAFTNLDGEKDGTYSVGNSQKLRFFDANALPKGLNLSDILVVSSVDDFANANAKAVYNLETGEFKYAKGYNTQIDVTIADTDGTLLSEGSLVELTYDGKTYELQVDKNGMISYNFDTALNDSGDVKTHFEFDVKATDLAGNTIDQHFLVNTSEANTSFNWARHKGEDLNFKTGSGDDSITTSSGNDYIDGGAGKDTINAGGGDDRVVFDANDRYVDGGLGIDTLVLKDNVDFTSLQNLDAKFDNFEAIDMRGEASLVVLNAKDVLDLSDNVDTIFKIDGDSGDSIKGEWSKASDQNGADQGYTLYEGQISSTQSVFIQVDDNIKIYEI
ncbi:MAG: hypothetical protein K5978_05505 [Campylobacter sp.]|nr:hypothetical protein [Campylobacter sp.]